jgi:hypothetical protein
MMEKPGKAIRRDRLSRDSASTLFAHADVRCACSSDGHALTESMP